MKLMLASIVAIFAYAGSAEVHTADFTQHSIREQGAIEIRMVVKDVVTDGCNDYGISGSFRTVDVADGTSTIVQDFVADFGIMQTQLDCGNTKPGKVTLQTEWFGIKDGRYVTVLAPKGWILEIR